MRLGEMDAEAIKRITKEQVDAARAAVGKAQDARDAARRADGDAEGALDEARQIHARLKRGFEQQQADGETDLETITRHIMVKMQAAGIIPASSPLLIGEGVFAEILPQHRLLFLFDKMANDLQQHRAGLKALDKAFAAYSALGITGTYTEKIHGLGMAAMAATKKA